MQLVSGLTLWSTGITDFCFHCGEPLIIATDGENSYLSCTICETEQVQLKNGKWVVLYDASTPDVPSLHP